MCSDEEARNYKTVGVNVKYRNVISNCLSSTHR